VQLDVGRPALSNSKHVSFDELSDMSEKGFKGDFATYKVIICWRLQAWHYCRSRRVVHRTKNCQLINGSR